MGNKISELLDDFFENKNASLKFSRKLVNKEFAIKLGIILIIAINVCIGLFLEGISSVGGLLTGKSFNILNIINPFRILKFAPIYIVLNGLTILAYVKIILGIRSSFKEIDEGQKGTSRFATQEEIHQQYRNVPASEEFYLGKGGVPVARNCIDGEEIIYIDDSPVNNLIIGTTRSGKGETFVVPLIDIYSRASEKSSLVINDPKGELVAMCKETLENRGYEVQMLNLLEPINSMSYNPLQLIKKAYKNKNYSEAQLLCNTLTHSLYTNPNTKDPFWENSAKSLVNALILAICDECIEKGEEDKITLYTVANMLSELGGSNEKIGDKEVNKLDEYFKKLPKDSVAKSQYATSSFAGGNTRGGIFSMAMSKLQNFTFEEIAKMTSKNSLDLEDIGFSKTNTSKPKAVFMVTPDYDTSNHVLVSIFVRQIYYVLAKQASLSNTGKCDREVIFLLDEFGNMPPIEGFANIITVCLGRGIRFNMIIQAYSQLKTLYGESAPTIEGNCGNQIYIMTNENDTAEKFSKLLGEKTIITNSRSGEVFSLSKNQTESLDARRLLKADELTKLKEGETVVVRVIKRQDKERKKIVSYPIFNSGKYAMRYRYEYLSSDFDNSNSVFKNVKIESLHKDVKLRDLIMDFEDKKVVEENVDEYNKNLNNCFNQREDIVNNNSSNIQEVQNDNILTAKDKELIINQAGRGILTEAQNKIICNQINTMEALESYLASIKRDEIYDKFLNLR